MRIFLAQLNPTVGDLDGNAAKIKAVHVEAAEARADLVVFPELFITGYPPEDLVLKQAFQDATMNVLEILAKDLDDGPAILTGSIWSDNGKLYNAAVHLDQGKIEGFRAKVHLPNYGVFDEKRVFDAGPMPGPINVRGTRIGVPICEDIWNEDVCECLSETGAELLISINGSPYDQSKPDERLNHAVARVTETGLPLIYLNQVGGQDELVFDGASFVLNASRELGSQLDAWQEATELTEWKNENGAWSCGGASRASIETEEAATYQACMLGLRDYVNKNGFPGVILGLSGGIDSALVAALCVDALGPDRVHAIMLPYKYTAEDSLEDARACAKALGIRYDVIPIEKAVNGLTSTLPGVFENTEEGTAEENIQSRARGTILMAVSNKFGDMVVTTGNKSEMSVGYATLYGDMNGGFNPIKDLYKTEVYALAKWRNKTHPKNALGPRGVVIPERILTKPPTAELRPNQTDQDSLPPYDILDDILRGLVENEQSIATIVHRGHDPKTVRKVERLLYISEYKRRQSAPGVKITSKNFGRDRRYPIVNRFRDTKPDEE